MMIQPHQRDRARIVAQHEMGHYVMAKAMGFTSGEVTLTLLGHDGHKAGATIYLEEPFESIEQVRRYLERRVVVNFAGAIAETLPRDSSPIRGADRERAGVIIKGITCESDYGKAREAIAMLRNIQHPGTLDPDEASEQKQQIYDRLWKRSADLVEQFEITIVGVAGALTQRLTREGKLDSYSATLSEDVLTNTPTILAIPKLEP